MLIAVLCISLMLGFSSGFVINPFFDTHILYLKPVKLLQISKTLKTTLSNLLESVCDDDCNPTPDASATPSVESTGDSTGTKPSLAKRRANQQDTETFYFTVRSPPLLLVCCALWPKICGHPLLFIKAVTVRKVKISISNKLCSFELSIRQIYHGFHRNIKRYNCFQH